MGVAALMWNAIDMRLSFWYWFTFVVSLCPDVELMQETVLSIDAMSESMSSHLSVYYS